MVLTQYGLIAGEQRDLVRIESVPAGGGASQAGPEWPAEAQLTL